MNAQPPRIAARNARNRQRDRALRAALTAQPRPHLEAVMLVALFVASVFLAIFLTGTDR